MKRSSSPTSPSSSLSDDPSPSPPRKKIKTTSKSAAKESGHGDLGIWTAEKRAVLIEELMMVGMEHVDKTALAEKLGVTKKQLQHQFEPNRSNIRKRIMEWARGKIAEKP